MKAIKRLLFAVLVILAGWVLIAFDQIGEYPDKIWLHRCNSIEKLIEKHESYPNIEIDVVFRDDHHFDVTHDSAISFNLDLKTYFFYMQSKSGKMWLDIKNLMMNNREELFSELERLVKYYKIKKERLIIESSDEEALSLFTQNGYYTSLYVTFDKPSSLPEKEMDSCISQLQQVADRKKVRALSFPGWWYTTIKKNLQRSIDLLTWKHRTYQFELMLLPIGRKMLHDPQLKVILVKEKGSFHR